MSAPLRPCLVLLALAACQQPTDYSGTLDTPAAIAVLDRGGPGPFREAVGYAADRHGGTIRQLALASNRYLADDVAASFFRGTPLATGDERVLTDLVAYGPDANTATVFALDTRYQQLLAVPHVAGREPDGSPREPEPRLLSVERLDHDSSGDDLTIDSLTVRPGFSASEVWTLTSNGAGWEVEGSRSGLQRALAFPNTPYLTPRGSLGFVVRTPGTRGDQIVLTVDSGLREIALPGAPLAIALSTDQSLAALTVGAELGHELRWFDPATEQLSAPVALSAGAHPHRLAWAPDAAVLLVTDARAPTLYAVDPNTDAVTEHPLPFVAQHLALSVTDARRTVFLSRADAAEVWLYDLDARTMIDVNLGTPEVDGMRFRSGVRGLALLPTAYEWPETIDGEQRSGRSVAVSLHEGRVVWMEEDTGCLVRDSVGPRTRLISQTTAEADYATINFTVTRPQTAYLEDVQAERRHINVNACAGIAPNETWTMRYDRTEQAWRVEGAYSGPQTQLAYEDERYLSDRVELSFLMRAGSLPSEDGWGVRFEVLDGILAADGDDDNDNVRTISLDLPSAPAVFHAEVDGVVRPFVVVAAETADVVLSLDPTDGTVQSLWD